MTNDPLARASRIEAARAEERVRAASIRLAARNCMHPVRCLRFDGLFVFEPDATVLAQLTCIGERGGCDNSITVNVRPDVRARALNLGPQAVNDGADVLPFPVHGGSMVQGSEASHAESEAKTEECGEVSG